MRLAAPAMLLLLARPAMAELCAARVELAGDAPVVGQVSDELARLGVERGAPAPGCRGVFAHVETDRDGRVAVAIRDGARRSEGRVVSDPAIAASWIDSWLHDDLDGRAWLLAAPVSPAPIATTKAAVVIDSVARPSPLERAQLSASWEHVWTDDNASADGIGIAGCVRIGKACIGGRARYVREGDRAVELTAMERSELSLLATVAMPLSAGRMSIAPEVGIGIGRMATRRIEGCASANPSDPNTPPGNCDPMDPTCVPQPQMCPDAAGKIFVGDKFSTSTISPRLAAGIRVAIPLFDHVWLDGSASLAVSPLNHGAFATSAEIVQPDGTVSMGESQFALPGEPAFGMWLGIGLRVGGL